MLFLIDLMVINNSVQEIADKTLNATAGVGKEVAGQASSYMLYQLKPFTTIFKTVGVLVLIYIGYRIWKWFAGMRDRQRLKNIEEKVNIIDTKVDRLLSGRKSSSDKEDKIEKIDKTEKLDKDKKKK